VWLPGWLSLLPLNEVHVEREAWAVVEHMDLTWATAEICGER
jgi:hypothetical protein